MNRSSSRSHWMTAPPTKIEPSSAYCTRPFKPTAIVVTSPCSLSIAVSPVFMSKKQPVPYVFFASPGVKQH